MCILLLQSRMRAACTRTRKTLWPRQSSKFVCVCVWNLKILDLGGKTQGGGAITYIVVLNGLVKN